MKTREMDNWNWRMYPGEIREKTKEEKERERQEEEHRERVERISVGVVEKFLHDREKIDSTLKEWAESNKFKPGNTFYVRDALSKAGLKETDIFNFPKPEVKKWICKNCESEVMVPLLTRNPKNRACERLGICRRCLRARKKLKT